MWNDRYRDETTDEEENGQKVEERARDLMPFSDVICKVSLSDFVIIGMRV